MPTAREVELASELDQLQERAARLERDLAEYRDYERRLDEVLTSKSWRVTKPLRVTSLSV